MHRSAPILFIIVMLCCMQPVQAVEQPDSHNTYLSVASDQLNLAVEHYRQGDLAASKQSLKKASDWLNRAVTHSEYESIKTEAELLAAEIDSFRDTLSHSSEENEITRLWHRATTLIARESEALINSYIQSSNENTILKHLLDAKMRFYFAEHDLFVSHDTQSAIEDLDKTLGYIAKAHALAGADLQPRLDGLTTRINALITLTESSADSWKQERVIESLEQAANQLTEATSFATPPVASKLNAAITNLTQLKQEIETTNLRTRYDAIMAELIQLVEHP